MGNGGYVNDVSYLNDVFFLCRRRNSFGQPEISRYVNRLATAQHPRGLPHPLCLSGFIHAGESRCLDAFFVALGQAFHGEQKYWYTSTLELQLASLEVCRACRCVPTLHVRDNDSTPRSLWSPPS